MDEASPNALNILATKTGRSVPDWLAIASAADPARTPRRPATTQDGLRHRARVREPADAHRSGRAVTGRRCGPRPRHYSGLKAALRPLHDLLIGTAQSLGRM